MPSTHWEKNGCELLLTLSFGDFDEVGRADRFISKLAEGASQVA